MALEAWAVVTVAVAVARLVARLDVETTEAVEGVATGEGVQNKRSRA
jgi:hypothetical protein